MQEGPLSKNEDRPRNLSEEGNNTETLLLGEELPLSMPNSKMNRTHFADVTLKMIEIIFAKDFEVFGYAKESQFEMDENSKEDQDRLWSLVPRPQGANNHSSE